VVDILVIYNATKCNLHTITTYINKIHSNIKLNSTYETHNSIDFLDLTISRKQTKLEIVIYRKPTSRGTIIYFLSNHPIEHKMAAFKFHISGMHSLPMDHNERQKEWKIIQSIAKTVIFQSTYSKNFTDRYNTKLATHKPKRKIGKSGPRSLNTVQR
jgi:hypothetical protein